MCHSKFSDPVKIRSAKKFKLARGKFEKRQASLREKQAENFCHSRITENFYAHSNVHTYHKCTLALPANSLCTPEISSKTAMKSRPDNIFKS